MGEREQKVFDIVSQGDQVQVSGDEITLSKGVVLLVKKVPPMILTEIEKRFAPPPVPRVYDENKGREIENPQDPRYLDQIDKVNAEKGMAITEVLIGLGTTIAYLPDELLAPEDDAWIDDVEVFLGQSVPRQGRGRYLAWLKYYVIESGEDLMVLASKVSAKMGVPEAEVGAAVARFQGDETRGADREASA